MVASAVNYQPASPPPSVVKTLLQTKGCVLRCDLETGADLTEAREPTGGKPTGQKPE